MATFVPWKLVRINIEEKFGFNQSSRTTENHQSWMISNLSCVKYMYAEVDVWVLWDPSVGNIGISHRILMSPRPSQCPRPCSRTKQLLAAFHSPPLHRKERGSLLSSSLIYRRLISSHIPWSCGKKNVIIGHRLVSSTFPWLQRIPGNSPPDIWTIFTCNVYGGVTTQVSQMPLSLHFLVWHSGHDCLLLNSMYIVFLIPPVCHSGAGDSGLNQIGKRRQFKRSSIKAQPGQEKLSIVLHTNSLKPCSVHNPIYVHPTSKKNDNLGENGKDPNQNFIIRKYLFL